MGYLAQSPETAAGFIPEVCPRGEGSGTEALKPEGARDKSVSGSEKISARVHASSR